MVQQNVNRTKKTADYFFNACDQRFDEKNNKKSTIDIVNTESDEVVKLDLDELKDILEDDTKLATTKAKATNFVINIREDSTKIKGQNWVCITCITKEGYRSKSFPNTKYDRPLIKVRGIFDTRYEAEHYIQNRIQHSDADFDVDLINVSKWAPISEYSYNQNIHVNPEVTSLVQGYLNNKNDQVTSHPKDRVMQATAMRSEALENDKNLNTLPFDSQMIPTANEEGGTTNDSSLKRKTLADDSAQNNKQLYISDVYVEKDEEDELRDIENQPKEVQNVVRLLHMAQCSKDRKKQDFLTYQNI